MSSLNLHEIKLNEFVWLSTESILNTIIESNVWLNIKKWFLCPVRTIAEYVWILSHWFNYRYRKIQSVVNFWTLAEHILNSSVKCAEITLSITIFWILAEHLLNNSETLQLNNLKSESFWNPSELLRRNFLKIAESESIRFFPKFSNFVTISNWSNSNESPSEKISNNNFLNSK